MYQMGEQADIKFRLNEINRKSVELTVVSCELANLAAQLNHLRKVNERFGIPTDRKIRAMRRRVDDRPFRRRRVNGLARVPRPAI
jgi:hypothetical protein